MKNLVNLMVGLLALATHSAFAHPHMSVSVKYNMACHNQEGYLVGSEPEAPLKQKQLAMDLKNSGVAVVSSNSATYGILVNSCWTSKPCEPHQDAIEGTSPGVCEVVSVFLDFYENGIRKDGVSLKENPSRGDILHGALKLLEKY